MKTGGVWLYTLILLGCGSSAQRSEPRSPRGDRDSLGGIVDAQDKCSDFFSQDCFADDDGCPDPPRPVVSFSKGSAKLSGAAVVLLARLAREIPRLAKATTLRIVGRATPGEPGRLAKARADAVRAWFRKRGITHRMSIGSASGRPRVELFVTGCVGDIG